jgi:hypothetical protein
MIKISTVAIKSLNDLLESIQKDIDAGGDKLGQLYATYRRYRERQGYRDVNGYDVWVDRVKEFIGDVIKGYQDDELRGETPSRCRTIESSNLMIMTHVTGGFNGEEYECEAHICITGGITGYYSGK